MDSSLRWDTDGDGIIDNAGFADQTYDAWSVTGARYAQTSLLTNLHHLARTNTETTMPLLPLILVILYYEGF